MKIPKNINRKLITFETMLFILIYLLITYIISKIIYSKLIIIYWGIMLIMLLILLLPSLKNKKKNNMMSIIYFLKYKNRKLYNYRRNINIYEFDEIYEKINERCKDEK